MVTASNKKILEILGLLSAVVLGIYLIFASNAQDRVKYSLIECDGVTNCQNLGVFHDEPVCNSIKDRLNSDVKIFIYTCERDK